MWWLKLISDFVSYVRIFLAGSIPHSVIGISHRHIPSFHTKALGSDRNEYQEYFLEDKDSRCVWLINLTLSCADCMEIWELKFPGPPGVVQARTRITLLYTFILILFLLLLCKRRIFFNTVDCSVVLLVNTNNCPVFTT